jgi:hypothetical protein
VIERALGVRVCFFQRADDLLRARFELFFRLFHGERVDTILAFEALKGLDSIAGGNATGKEGVSRLTLKGSNSA